MSTKILSCSRARQILSAASKTRVLVLGDVMLDQFIWGGVSRISPEAPVPVVDFERESFMPGGAANVARNLTALNVPTELLGVIGHDDAANRLKQLLAGQKIGCTGLVTNSARHTSQEPSPALNAALAANFRANGDNFRPFLHTLFRSQEFYGDDIVRN